MKNLWTTLPPLLSDNFGFIEVIKNSSGCGIIDDSGEFRLGGSNSRGGRGHGGHSGNRGLGAYGHGGIGGHQGGGHGGSSSRIAVSNADIQDVTNGTREALLRALDDAYYRYSPDFALLSLGPCGAMIGTDLGEIARAAEKKYNISSAAVSLSGQRTYDIGIARTTEALIRLMTRPAEREAGTINILGVSALDWCDDDISALGEWVAAQGFRIIAQPGCRVTISQLQNMGKAQLNLVATVSGLPTARYMQAQFGTSFIALSPFGLDFNSGLLNDSTRREPLSAASGAADALIIGEQFAANAVRRKLEENGTVKRAAVASFFTLDRDYARSGDIKIQGNDHAKQLLSENNFHLVAADPLLHPLLDRRCRWIDLPHRAFNLYSSSAGASMLGGSLDVWLNRQL